MRGKGVSSRLCRLGGLILGVALFRFVKPRKQFVLASKWDPSKRGDLDETKVVEEEIFGKLQRGIWVQVGEDGVFDYDEYDEKALKEVNVEYDSLAEGAGGFFGKEQLKRKRKAAQDALEAGARARELVSQRGPDLSLSNLVATIQASHSGAASSSVSWPWALGAN